MNMRLVKEIFMRRGRNKCIYLLLVLTLMGKAGFNYLGFYLSDSVYSKPPHVFRDTLDQLQFRTDLVGHTAQTDVGPSFDDVVEQNLKFDIEGRDVIVFLHIQKTGGTTFGQHLVTDLELARPCVCHGTVKWCTCPRPGKNSSETWLFSRHTTGWKCGVHAGWTELTNSNCVDEVMNKRNGNRIKKRYFYITMLRHPVHRFVSEFHHVRLKSGWNNALLKCQGRRATKMEVPPCYYTKIWENVTMDEFMACSSNLAMNRETRMLADLSLVGCYNTSMMTPEDRGRIMLLSAKRNLKKMAFYGLTEEQGISQYLFEVIFNLRFKKPFRQFNQTVTNMAMMGLDAETIKRIEELNSLDLELYEYAVKLFQQRFKKLSAQYNKTLPEYVKHISLGRS